LINSGGKPPSRVAFERIARAKGKRWRGASICSKGGDEPGIFQLYQEHHLVLGLGDDPGLEHRFEDPFVKPVRGHVDLDFEFRVLLGLRINERCVRVFEGQVLHILSVDLQAQILLRVLRTVDLRLLFAVGGLARPGCFLGHK
jgi:hypothetical protein